MCIIIVGLGVECPDRDVLEDSCLANPDGVGWSILTVDDNGARRLITRKYIDDVRGVSEFLAAMAIEGDSVLYSVFHARIGTHGAVMEENCHPFPVGDNSGTFLFHNGIMPECHTKDDPRTDSAIFAAEWLPAIGGVNALARPQVEAIVKDFARGSKLVIVGTALPVPIIINEEDGEWQEGLWFSNQSHKYGAWRTWGPSTIGGISSTDDDEKDTGGSWWRDAEQCRWCAADLAEDGWCFQCVLCQECGAALSGAYSNGKAANVPYCADCEWCDKCGEWRGYCDCTVSTLADELDRYEVFETPKNDDAHFAARVLEIQGTRAPLNQERVAI